MSHLKKFNDNGQEIGTEDVPVDENNFELYFRQYGIERSKGYLDCISDIVNLIDKKVITNDKDPRLFNSEQVQGRRILKLHYDINELVNILTSQLESLAIAGDSNPDQKYSPE